MNWSKVIQPSGRTITPEEIGSFEQALGFALPLDYREFLLSCNGGKVLIDHDLPAPELGADIGVDCFYPLTQPKPSLGVAEIRNIQIGNHICLSQAIEIGGDMGTGSYYLILDGKKRGAVCFIWDDDKAQLLPGAWDAWQTPLPPDMIEVSATFDGLGELILRHQI